MRRSGKYAYVDGVGCTVSWGVNEANSASRYTASCVPDGTAAVPGNIDQTGSITGMGYLPFMPKEDDFEFVGVASAKEGEIVNYEGNILVTEATLNIPVGAGTPITWTSSFGVQGELAKTTATAYEDNTHKLAPSAKDGGIRIETAPSTFTPIADVQNITLTFRRPANTLVDAGLTYRESGNLEVDLNFEVKNDDLMVAAYARNTINKVRVYVTPTLFFLLDSILWKDKSNFTVNRQSGELIGYTVSGLWTALSSSTTDTLGQIKMPDDSVFYPTPAPP